VFFTHPEEVASLMFSPTTPTTTNAISPREFHWVEPESHPAKPHPSRPALYHHPRCGQHRVLLLVREEPQARGRDAAVSVPRLFRLREATKANARWRFAGAASGRFRGPSIRSLAVAV